MLKRPWWCVSSLHYLVDGVVFHLMLGTTVCLTLLLAIRQLHIALYHKTGWTDITGNKSLLRSVWCLSITMLWFHKQTRRAQWTYALTDTHTTLHLWNICSKRPHLMQCMQAMQPAQKMSVKDAYRQLHTEEMIWVSGWTKKMWGATLRHHKHRDFDAVFYMGVHNRSGRVVEIRLFSPVIQALIWMPYGATVVVLWVVTKLIMRMNKQEIHDVSTLMLQALITRSLSGMSARQRW